MNDLPRLETSIKENLGPCLRSDGFVGSGRTFRKITEDFIFVLNVQGSRYGGQFAINLGVQPLCIPNVLGQEPDKKKITEPLCEFRRRLSKSGKDQWWTHDTTKESMDVAIKEATSVYCDIGRQSFSSFEGLNSPFHVITAEAFESGDYSLNGFGSTAVRMGLASARFREAKGQTEDAKKFALAALGMIGSASSLRKELESICANV